MQSKIIEWIGHMDDDVTESNRLIEEDERGNVGKLAKKIGEHCTCRTFNSYIKCVWCLH